MATAATETTRAAKAAALPPLDAPLRPTAITHAPDDLPLYRITTDIDERMLAAGVFGDTSPIDLWKGQPVLPMTRGPDHENAPAAVLALPVPQLPGGYHLRPGSPVRIPDVSEPEPDLLLLRDTIRDDLKKTPSPADVALVVEVSDTSLRLDSGAKLAAYAEAGIPVYWVVNILERRVEVSTAPTGPADHAAYRNRKDFGPNDEVPVVLDGREFGRLPVRELLP